MDDGRTLKYYDFAPHGEEPPFLAIHREAAAGHPPNGPRILEHPPEMRWNPALGEWTVVAANRMNRPMLPSADACPLCPGIVELPLNYQIAIFENRAPSLAYIPGDDAIPDTHGLFDGVAKARGRCDVVVYAQEHGGKFADMSTTQIYALIEAWRDRYGELAVLPEVEYAAIFENKGRDAGMTLDHPHGQIYAFPFLPPMIQAKWNQTQSVPNLWQRIVDREASGPRVIAETEGFLAAVPFYARYPYEVHIWARREGVHSLTQMTPDERRQLAGLMKNIVSRYENMWPDAKYGFPTMMLMHQLSERENVENFRFHIEWLPLQRSVDKLKYRACIESGTGSFLNDALPESQADELRQAAPHEVELPQILFS